MPEYNERELTASEQEAINPISCATGMSKTDIINTVQSTIDALNDALNKEAEARKEAIEHVDSEKRGYHPDKKERKKEKLPKRLRNGW